MSFHKGRKTGFCADSSFYPWLEKSICRWDRESENWNKCKSTGKQENNNKRKQNKNKKWRGCWPDLNSGISLFFVLVLLLLLAFFLFTPTSDHHFVVLTEAETENWKSTRKEKSCNGYQFTHKTQKIQQLCPRLFLWNADSHKPVFRARCVFVIRRFRVFAFESVFSVLPLRPPVTCDPEILHNAR